MKSKRVPLLLSALCVLAAAALTAAAVWSGAHRGIQRADTPLSPAANDPYPAPIASIVVHEDGVRLDTVVDGGYFYTRRGGEWRVLFLKGVEVSPELPGGISYETFFTWFGQIAAMNANTLLAPERMTPDFYRALSDHNAAHPDAPLYLLQGILPDGVSDAQDASLPERLEQAARGTVDAVYGKSAGEEGYDRDVSAWVLGFLLGPAWDAPLISAADSNDPVRVSYEGEYLRAPEATPFETLLCEAGDRLIRYETETYAAQHPVAFQSAADTDPIVHTNQPDGEAASVDFARIESTGKYRAKLFTAISLRLDAAGFLNYQPEYLNYTDPQGRQNPLRAYLKDLHEHYGACGMPLVAVDVGGSTARGASGETAGYRYGATEETEQGRAVVSMVSDLARESFAGAMLSAWQDSWSADGFHSLAAFPEDAEPALTPDAQSPAQGEGILAVEPGASSPACLPDGDFSEWAGESAVFGTDTVDFFVKYDEKYLYLYGRLKQAFDFETQRLLLALSVTGRGSDHASDYGLSFDHPADFLLTVDGRYNTRVLADASGDLFYYQYAILQNLAARSEERETPNSGLFVPIHRLLHGRMTLPLDGTQVSPEAYETGVLRFGSADPASGEYSSLSDFYFNESGIEIRIPWSLLNVASPVGRWTIGSLYENEGVVWEPFETLWFGAADPAPGEIAVPMREYAFAGLERAQCHTRLKKSYAILAAGLRAVMPDAL